MSLRTPANWSGLRRRQCPSLESGLGGVLDLPVDSSAMAPSDGSCSSDLESLVGAEQGVAEEETRGLESLFFDGCENDEDSTRKPSWHSMLLVSSWQQAHWQQQASTLAPEKLQEVVQKQLSSTVAFFDYYSSHYKSQNIISCLGEHYQKQGDGIALTSEAFSDVSVSPVDHGDPKIPPNTLLWQSVLNCPLSGKPRASSIPVAALMEEGPSKLSSSLTSMLGKHYIYRGTVYFTTKKAARKAAALAHWFEVQKKTKPTLDEPKETQPPQPEVPTTRMEVEPSSSLSSSDVGVWDALPTELVTVRETSNYSPIASYLRVPPLWARTHFTKESKRGYLYRAEITDERKIGPRMAPLLFGLMTAVPLEVDSDQHISATFAASPDTQMSNPDYRITLLQPSQPIEVDWQALTNLQVEHLRLFQKVVQNWKLYGLHDIELLKTKVMEDPHGGLGSRGYLLVPLKKGTLSVDWTMLQSVAEERTSPYAKPSWIGRLQGMFHEYVIYSFAILASGLPEASKTFPPHSVLCTAASRTGNSLWCGVLFLVTLRVLFARLPGLVITESGREAHNDAFVRLRLRRKKSRLYQLATDDSYSRDTRTAMVSLKALRRLPVDKIWRKLSEDCPRATLYHYYLSRHKIDLQFPHERLVPLVPVTKHENQYGDYSPPSSSHEESENTLEPVEILEVLPLSRRLLYGLSTADMFLPALERRVALAYSIRTLNDIAREYKHTGDDIGVNSVPCCHMWRNGTHRERQFIDLLDEATAMFPRTRYQRLEFLGDAVLGHAIALNLFAMSPSVEKCSLDMNKMHSLAGSNKTLSKAALRIGLPRLIHCKRSICWGVLPPEYVSVSDQSIADIVESTLATSYLKGDQAMLVGILNKLNIPFTKGGEEGKSKKWFVAPNMCLRGGYLFDDDPDWRLQLSSIASTLAENKTTFDRLSLCFENLLCKLPRSHNFHERISRGHGRHLIMAALFNDDLSALEADKFSEGYLERMQKVGRLRDMLFHVGAYSLHLMICEEAFRLDSSASEGDLHLVEACCVADDVVTYLMITHGWTECTYDQTIPFKQLLAFVQREIIQANSVGAEKWKQAGGDWILKGGVEEYRRRLIDRFGLSEEEASAQSPKYEGLCGGRLYGNQWKLEKRHAKTIADDFVFTFKCIVGAFVLTLGLDAMWSILGPSMFQELLVLSADDLREVYHDDSDLCRNLSKGSRQQERRTSSATQSAFH